MKCKVSKNKRNINFMKNHKLTINLITYNHEKYIAKCLDSLLSQKTNFSFIIRIFDDCSTDSTTAICKEYEDKYPDIIKLYPSEKNLGISQNALRSYKDIETPYYIFIEGDDYCCNDEKFQMQVDTLDKNPDCSFCVTKTTVDYPNCTAEFIDSFPNLNQGKYTYESIQNLQESIHSHLPSRMVRTSAITLDPDCYQFFLWDSSQTLELMEKGNMYVIDKVTNVYRIKNSGMCSGLDLQDKYDYVFNEIAKYNRYTNFKHEKQLFFILLGQLKHAYCLKYAPYWKSSDVSAKKYKIRKLKHYFLPQFILDIGNLPRDISRKIRKICNKGKS